VGHSWATDPVVRDNFVPREGLFGGDGDVLNLAAGDPRVSTETSARTGVRALVVSERVAHITANMKARFTAPPGESVVVVTNSTVLDSLPEQ
jgi:hypothetical protein